MNCWPHRNTPALAAALSATLSSLLLAWPGPAVAGVTPGSALATAREMAPSLLDSPAQAFTHPQVSVLGTSSIATWSTGEYSSYGALAATWSLGSRVALAALSQHLVSDDPYDLNSLRSGQAAVRIGSCRVGAAYRWGTDDSGRESERLTVDSRGFVSRDYQSYGQSADIREWNAGFGWTRGRGFVDVTADRTRTRARSYDLEERSNGSVVDTHIAVDTDPRWGGAFRFGVPLGSRMAATAFGSFHDRRFSLDVRFLDDIQLPIRSTQEAYGHAWDTGIDFARDLSSVGRVHAHGMYADSRAPGEPYSYDVGFSTRRMERTEAGFSLERPGWWDSVLYFGVRAFRQRTWTDRIQVNSYSSTFYFNRDTDFNESWSHDVAWGASRTIGDFDFCGVISRVLSVSSPIVALDATLRF